MSDQKRLVLLDGHALLFRAYYAFPPLTSSEGLLVNAVYGFLVALLSVINDFEPEYIAVMFDSKGPTKRKKVFEAYKAQRKPPPEDLIAQVEPTKNVVKTLNVPIFELVGYEADDLIGTIANQSKKIKGLETIIVTGDKDLFQLIDDGKVHVYMPGRGRTAAVMYEETQVIEKMGVRKDQIVDFKGLAGDASDNIPGVKGVGPKTAVGLLREFGTVEGVYAAIEKGDVGMIGKSILAKLIANKEMALKSKELATIMLDAPIELDLQACKVSGYDKQAAMEEFERLGFKSLIRRLPDDDFEKGVQEALF